MQIEFYFDPACPFCWITSRWLLDVASARDVTIDWLPFSLAIKNNELAKHDNDSSEASAHRASHRVHRVILATQKLDKKISMSDLYSSFGHAYHVDGRDYDDSLISAVLDEFNLPSDLIQAADDTSYDEALESSTDSAVEVVGEDTGTPTIVFVDDDGGKRGFFGPVLQSLPGHEAGLKLWDGLSQLASDDNFYELKRTRPSGQPNTQSTDTSQCAI